MLTEENKINDKNILIDLIKKILNDSLNKLEKRNEEQNNDLKFIQKNYSEFTKNLDFLVNEVEENEKNLNNNNDNNNNKENNDKNFKSLEKKIKIPQNSNTPKVPLDKRKEFKRSATTSGKLKSDEKNKKSENKNDSKDGKELKNNKSDISKNIINNKRKTITNFNLNEKTLKNISNNVHNSKEKNKVKDNKDNKKNNSKEKPLTSRNEDPKGKKMSRSKTEKNINEGPGKNKSKISSKFGKTNEKDKKEIKKETKKIEKKDKKKEDKKEEKKEEEKKEEEIKNEEKKDEEKKVDEKKEEEKKDDEKKGDEKKEEEKKEENNKEEEEKKIELDIKKVEIIQPNQEESKKEESKKEEEKEESKKEEPKKEEEKEESKKEEKKEEPKKEIPPFSSSTFIIPEYNKEKYFDIIMSYLTVPEQLTFYSSSKNLKNKLISIIISYQSILHKELEIDNPLRIEDRINDFKQKHSEEEINKSITEFSLSKGTIKAIELLNNELYDKIFKKSILEDNLKEILIIYRILFYLLSENEIAEIKDENLFWNKMREYLLNKSEGKIGTFISNSVKNFNFNNKTIYLINKLVKDIKNKIIPSYYTKICGTTGLVVFLIKDALEYCGIIYSDKKTQPSIIYKNLEYEKEQVYKIHNYIEFLNKL